MSSNAGGPRGPREAVETARAAHRLSVLTFEAGDHVLGIPSGDVERLAAPDEPLPQGTTVVDAVGLLPRAEASVRERRCGCYVILSSREPRGAPVAITASRAGEVRMVEPGRLLPLPGFLFPRENPFVGLIPPEEHGRRRPVFVVAGPERLLACAGAR